MLKDFQADYIVVGSGFAGATIAERIASKLNSKVLVVEKREHIGGNSYDYYDENGFLIHKYGPHIFHTEKKWLWDYVSNFTDWRHYIHRVLAYIDGKKVPLPFNLNSLYGLFPTPKAFRLEKKLLEKFGPGQKIHILELRSAQDQELKELADFIYRKVFLNYTLKQWGMRPEELSPEVTGRVPIFISWDNSYFQDRYQGIPLEGYTRIFERMLSNPNIKVLLRTDAREIIQLDFLYRRIYLNGREFQGRIIYTGPIDELLDFKYGELPYRSLRFQLEVHPVEYYQEVAVVNYPNDYAFTRITEFKHLTGQAHPKTIIAKEFPQEYRRDEPGKDIPYYPILREDEVEKYMRYRREIEKFDGKILLVGRLAEYKYLNMDKAIEGSLELFENKIK